MGSPPRYQLDQFLTGSFGDYRLSDKDLDGDVDLALAKFCPTATWIEVERKIVFANAAAIHLVGANSPAELLGKSSLTLFRDGRRGSGFDLLERLDGTVIEVEHQVQSFVWKQRAALVRTLWVRPSGGSQESPLSSLASLAPVAGEAAAGLIGLSLDGAIVNWNQGAEKILGFGAAEVAGQPLSFIVPEALKKSILAFFERVKSGANVEHFRTILRGSDGQGVYASMWISPVRDDVGNVAGITARVIPLLDENPLGDVTSAGLCYSDPEHRLVKINPRMAEILHVNAQESIGRTWAEVFPELTGQIDPVLGQVAASGQAVYGVRLESLGAWVMCCRPVRNTAGEFLGVSTVLQDPASPAARERQIEAALSRIADPVILADNDWSVTFANQAATPAGTNWQGRSLWELLEGAGPELRQSLRDAKAGHRQVQFENQDGAGSWFENVIHPSPDGILLWRRDVTAQKAAEQKRKENEAIYRAIGDSIDYGIWICDAAGRNVYTSESFQKLTGLTQEECSGYGWTRALRSEHATLAIGAWQDCIRDGYKWDTEYWFWGADRRWHPILSRGAPVYDEGGGIMCWAGIFLDIRAFKTAQQQLEDANESLSRTNQELEQFAYIASHDLQEPLRVIRLMTRLVASRYQGTLDPAASKYLATIEDSSTRMAGLVRDLLDYARVLHVAPQPGRVSDLDEALAIAIQNCRHLIEETSAIISSGPLPKVTSDGSQMTRVFQNLIANALKYKRDEPPVIKIRVDQRGSEWRVCVEDNGQGILSDEQSLVFLPFKRLHGAEIPGSGLGLAVCKKIVEHHGGRIWVESQPGVGSLFYFTLPMD